MRHEPGGAGKKRQSLDGLHRVADVKHHRGDRAADVDWERPPGDLRRMLLQKPQHGDVIAGDAALVGELQEKDGARIAGSMLRMAEAGHLLLFRDEPLQSSARHVLQRNAALSRLGQQSDQIFSRHLRAARNYRAYAEEPSGHRALPSFRRSRERHAGGLHARHEPVLGDRHQHRVGEEALLVGRHRAGDEEVEIVGEAHLSDQVAAKVEAAHGDRIGVRRRDRGERLVLLADSQLASSRVWNFRDFSVRLSSGRGPSQAGLLGSMAL